jgi:hypothetical protein
MSSPKLYFPVCCVMELCSMEYGIQRRSYGWGNGPTPPPPPPPQLCNRTNFAILSELSSLYVCMAIKHIIVLFVE